VDILDRAKLYKRVDSTTWEVIKRMQKLRQLGQTDKEIEAVIKSLNLPLGMHMFILGHYSDLMEAV
jgi:hypothetical protein